MILNYIWIGFFVIGLLVALYRLIGYWCRDFFAEQFGWLFDSADLNVFHDMVQSTFEMSKASINILLVLAGVMTFWLGLLKIAEKAGLIEKLSIAVAPVLGKLFPDIPNNHPAMGSMMMNFSANMLGLGNAATPFGLKAMEQLQELNPNKQVASNSQIMFLVLNTSGLTIIPLSVLAIRLNYESMAPAEIFVPVLLTTLCSTLVGMIVTSIAQKVNLFQKNILIFFGVVASIMSLVIWFVSSANSTLVEEVTGVSGNLLLFMIIIVILIVGYRKKLDLYSTFVEGGKEGFKTAIKILPYLVAMLVGIGVFRASGALDLIIDGLELLFTQLFTDTRFVDVLPVGIMRPFSGGGAEAMMIDVIKNSGVDSFRGQMATVMQGSTETTFYVLAVYFGSVGIKNTRNAVYLGLMADVAGIIAAICFSYLFFA